MLLGSVIAFGLVATSVVPPIVEGAGSATCPSTASVQQDLASLSRADSGAANATRPARRVRLSEGSAGVQVDLLTSTGEVLATRVLPADRSCADLSIAAAVVIATWEAELDAGEGERFSVGPEPAPPVTAPMVISRPAAPVEGRRANPANFALGLGVVTSVAGANVAPGGRIEAWLAPPDHRLGVALSVSAVAARSAAIAERDDAARWWRATLAAGPEYRLGGAPRFIGFHVQALASALRIAGVGLPSTRTDTSAQLGVGTGAIAGWAWGHGMAWLGADALLFPGQDQLIVEGLTGTGALPHLEIQVAVGVSFGRLR